MSRHLIGPVILATAVAIACLIGAVHHAIERHLNRHIDKGLHEYAPPSNVRVIPYQREESNSR